MLQQWGREVQPELGIWQGWQLRGGLFGGMLAWGVFLQRGGDIGCVHRGFRCLQNHTAASELGLHGFGCQLGMQLG